MKAFLSFQEIFKSGAAALPTTPLWLLNFI